MEQLWELDTTAPDMIEIIAVFAHAPQHGYRPVVAGAARPHCAAKSAAEVIASHGSRRRPLSIVSRMAYSGDDRAQGGGGSVFRYLWAVYAFIGQDHADLLRIAVPSLDQFGFLARFRPGQVGDLARVVRDII